jgi:hypothetical protein
MLRNGEANPLTVHGLRELAHCPPHFVKVTFELRNSYKQIADWIWENFEGRFWLGDHYYLTESGTTAMGACAAFEIPGEASMFSLCLDQIQQSYYHTYN